MILKGQTIIRRGEIATQDHIDILSDLGLLSPTFDAVTLASIVVMVVVLLAGIGVYLPLPQGYLHPDKASSYSQYGDSAYRPPDSGDFFNTVGRRELPCAGKPRDYAHCHTR